MSNLDKFNKVLAIQNYGPSGSLFLQSLLDGHPNILSTPALYMREFYRFWEEQYPFKSVIELIQKFILSPYHLYWFENNAGFQVLSDNGLLTMGKDCNENIFIDVNRFAKFLFMELKDINIQEITSKKFIIAVYLAYARTRDIQIQDNMWILFPIHSNQEKYARNLRNDFSIMKVIHMVRDPVIIYYSVLKYFINNPDKKINKLSSILTHLYFDELPIDENQKFSPHSCKPYFPDDANTQSRAVRLEDLHETPKTTLMNICNWLQIPWHDCLLSSTFNGKLWNNNGPSIRKNGFGNKDVSQQYKNKMSKFDLLRLRIIFNEHAKAYNYKWANKNSWNYISYLLLNILPYDIEYIDGQVFRNYFSNRKFLAKIYRHMNSRKLEFVPMLEQIQSVQTEREIGEIDFA